MWQPFESFRKRVPSEERSSPNSPIQNAKGMLTLALYSWICDEHDLDFTSWAELEAHYVADEAHHYCLVCDLHLNNAQHLRCVGDLLTAIDSHEVPLSIS